MKIYNPLLPPPFSKVGTTRNRGGLWGNLKNTEESDQEIEMEKWKCNVCGYIYDPEKGDPDGNIPPNTPFNKIPDDWVCPMCGAPKDMFEKA